MRAQKPRFFFGASGSFFGSPSLAVSGAFGAGAGERSIGAGSTGFTVASPKIFLNRLG